MRCRIIHWRGVVPPVREAVEDMEYVPSGPKACQKAYYIDIDDVWEFVDAHPSLDVMIRKGNHQSEYIIFVTNDGWGQK